MLDKSDESSTYEDFDKLEGFKVKSEIDKKLLLGLFEKLGASGPLEPEVKDMID